MYRFVPYQQSIETDGSSFRRLENDDTEVIQTLGCELGPNYVQIRRLTPANASRDIYHNGESVRPSLGLTTVRVEAPGNMS
jgi:hypothetical protein